MIINQVAQAVFDSFAGTGVVVAILSRNGSYVASKVEVFEKVFADRRLLDELRRRVDDGQEPLLAQMDGFFIAAASLSSGVGYAVMLVPACSFEQSEDFDFIEVILEQFSVIAGLVEQNQQLRDFGESVKSDAALAAFAAVG